MVLYVSKNPEAAKYELELPLPHARVGRFSFWLHEGNHCEALHHLTLCMDGLHWALYKWSGLTLGYMKIVEYHGDIDNSQELADFILLWVGKLEAANVPL